MCVCTENTDIVAGLKGRVKAARDSTKDLLRAVNGTMATLNAIPNGMTVGIHSMSMCVCSGQRYERVDQYQRMIEVSRSGKLNLTHVSTQRHGGL